jgi:hypothetical protein
MVLLFSNVRFNGAELTLSLLANDPRVHTNLPSPKNSADDPSSPTAVFITPFYSATDVTSWYDLPYYGGYTETPAAAGQLDPLEGAIPEWVNELKQAGYRSEIVKDADVDVTGLVNALVPGPGTPTQPGFVFFQTHGAYNWVALGTKLDDRRPQASLRAELDRLDELFPDLLTFRGGTPEMPLTLADFYIKMTRRPWAKRLYLAVTPVFWDWLRERGADFSRSFFYLAACQTGDDRSDFPYAINARAYFGHRGDASNVLEHALLDYFIRSLGRYTRTAEEAYYNILRVQNTGEMIYAEDNLLNGRIFSGIRDANTLVGFGLAEGAVWRLSDGGWLGTQNIDPGGFWWMLFGARWSSDAASAAEAIRSCWDDYWSNGDAGGIAAPGCNAMTPGYVPSQDEVAYVSYLLTGTPVVPFSGRSFARFTLHDGE